MNCRDYSNAKRIRAGWTMAALLSLSILGANVGALASNAPDKLNQLEQSIVGTSSSNLSIEKRIKQLEIKVFAKVQAGSFSTRIAALENFAGITESNSRMPPLAPRSESNLETAKTAAQSRILKAHNKTGAETSKSSVGLDQKLEEAVKLHHTGKVEEAEKSLRVILANNPKNTDAYFSLGAIAESRGDLKSALEFYTSAMQSNPNDTEAQEAVAELSKKITATVNQPFVNPLDPAPAPESSKVLQGRAWELNGGAANNNLQAQTPFTAPNIQTGNISGRQGIPTLGVTQPTTRSAGSTFARTLARAALGAALTGAGLHCPACHILQGF